MPVLVWSLARPMLSIASAPVGGGIGLRSWVVNAQVPADYTRTDIGDHLESIAAAAGCVGDGVGFLTAAAVEHRTIGRDEGVVAYATVGLQVPTWAAAPEDAAPAHAAGTVNIVAFSPVRLADAALVNAVVTMTEAKTQALLDRGVEGTGTASDAVCLLAPSEGPVEPFAGPRSTIGSRLARAVHAAVAAGADDWLAPERER